MVFAYGRHANCGSVESFFRTHKYLVEHLGEPIRRKLMDMVDWNHRLIGIKGTRGVGKTTFLLQYAKANFDVSQKDCLYVNMNHFVFTQRTLVDFAEEFRLRGGKTLLIDQIFKYANWSRELRMCYDRFSDLKIVFTGSTVMQIGKNNPDLEGIVKVYNIRGFSFREFLNLTIGTDFRAYSFQEVIHNHRAISSEICRQIKPLAHFRDYVHHGYYPFFLEKRNFSENLLKTMNMMLEVDVLVVKQIEQSYLPKLRKLFYLLAQSAPGAPNISQLSVDCDISRATVTNYIEYLKAARLINTLYRDNEEFPKKARYHIHAQSELAVPHPANTGGGAGNTRNVFVQPVASRRLSYQQGGQVGSIFGEAPQDGRRNVPFPCGCPAGKKQASCRCDICGGNDGRGRRQCNTLVAVRLFILT